MQITLEIFKRKRILESSKTYEYSTNVEESIAHPSSSDFSVKNDLIVSLFTTPPERREGEGIVVANSGGGIRGHFRVS